MSMETGLVSVNVGAFINANRVIAQIPTYGGGVTFLTADLIGSAAATTSVYLVDLGASGTVIAGTIASFAGTIATANIPYEGTMVTPFVEGGHYIGVKEANAGTTPAVTIVTASYTMGE